MTTKAQDTTKQDTTKQDATPQRRGRCAGMVAGKRGAAAGKTITGKTAAGRARPIFGESEAVCRGVVEHAFGKRHWAAKWALDLCKADPRFLTHLAEQPRGYAHYLCLIRMALLARGGDGSARAEARMLQAGNKRKLLKELFPSCPTGIVNLLPKLPSKPLLQHEYRSLLHALADKRIRKHLMHIKRIKKFDLLLASDALHFPAQFRAAAMRGIKDEDDYEAFLRVMHAANKLDLNIAEREIVQAADQLEARDLDDWLMGKVAERPFPTPPWAGDDEVRPVRSRAELKDAGEKFDNCLSGSRRQIRYAFSVAAGFIYFYVCERMPALVKVEHEIFWGWRIDEMEGAKNESLTSRQEHELTRRFLKAGIAPEQGHRLRHRRRRRRH